MATTRRRASKHNYFVSRGTALTFTLLCATRRSTQASKTPTADRCVKNTPGIGRSSRCCVPTRPPRVRVPGSRERAGHFLARTNVNTREQAYRRHEPNRWTCATTVEFHGNATDSSDTGATRLTKSPGQKSNDSRTISAISFYAELPLREFFGL